MLAVDKAMFPPAVFTAHSALRSNPKTPFDLIIAVPENMLPREWIDYAERRVGVLVREVAFQKLVGLTRSVNVHLPLSTVYRYFFDRFLGASYRKLVYLDGDIQVTGDISALFTLDLEGRPFAAAPDVLVNADVGGEWRSAYRQSLGLDETACYANTGVLLIDPASWAREDISGRVLDYLDKHLNRCALMDQSALNATVHGDYPILSPVWNMMSSIWFGSDIRDTVHPSVLHYAGPGKPWQPLRWHYDTATPGAYRKFFRDSPWPEAMDWSGSFQDWRSFFRFRRRAVLRRIRGRPAARQLAPATVKRFRQLLATLPFIDVRQGITARQPDGSLRAA